MLMEDNYGEDISHEEQPVSIEHDGLTEDCQVPTNGRRGSDVPSEGRSSSSGVSESPAGAKAPRKRVQFITDEHIEELPEYKIQPNMAYKVTFPYKTWDVMMQGFRNALEYDTVFICDYFLGNEIARGVLRELALFRDSRLFERYMKRAQDCSPPYNYASLCLLEQENTHPKLDTLSLMVYKLASYYTSDWTRVSVELSYYPDGHRKQTISKHQASNRKVLKCMYFPNPDWKVYLAGIPSQPAGSLTIHTTHRGNTTRPMTVDPVFDRLVVFWGDTLDHEISECPQETFRIIVWIQR